MIDERFPYWDVDVEKGTIYSLKHKRNVGSVGNGSYLIINNHKYKHKGVHQYIWMIANQADIPEGYDVHHIDGNPLNNSIYNLELVELHAHRSEHKKNRIVSEETKKKMSESMKNMSEETKKKISETLKGFKHTEETKMKMSKAKKGIQLNRKDLSKQVAQYTLEGELVKIWNSVMECGRNGFNHTGVSKCCLGKRKTHKGYIWKYLNEERDVA